jgi:hypothetical protein
METIKTWLKRDIPLWGLLGSILIIGICSCLTGAFFNTPSKTEGKVVVVPKEVVTVKASAPTLTPVVPTQVPPTQVPQVGMDLTQYLSYYDSLTDIQKKDFVAQSIGKWVDWSGEISDVSEDGTVQVRMPGTLTGMVDLKGIPRETAVNLYKGETIHFTGRITDVIKFIFLYIYLDRVQIQH